MLIYPKTYVENVTKITIEFLRENNIELTFRYRQYFNRF